MRFLGGLRAEDAEDGSSMRMAATPLLLQDPRSLRNPQFLRYPSPVTLLFITQKVHGQDAFGALWIRQFQARGYDVRVICLEARPQEAGKLLADGEPFVAEVHSLGKERGVGRIGQILRFWRFILTLQYDRVFIHMTPVWGLVGAPVWLTVRRVPVYLWYTHYTMQAGLWLLGFYAKRMFCATPQSLPQYQGSPRKVVTGHGIDLRFWPVRPNVCAEPHRLLMVHRLARSKRVELSIKALRQLPKHFTLDIYGNEPEPAYAAELKALVTDLGIADRVSFHGTVAAKDLPAIYACHRLMLNLASETIDKTMLECLTCGCYPVTTHANAQAIGLPAAPGHDTPEAIHEFVMRYFEHLPMTEAEMYRVVEERHSLQGLMEKMDRYIRPGI